MLIYGVGKKYGHFELRKAIVKNPVFGVKTSIVRFLSIFACICKGFEVDPHHVFYHQKKTDIKMKQHGT